MAAGYRNRSQEKKIDKINRKPACDNGSKIIAGFHLGFKVWGGGRFTHTAKCLATPTFDSTNVIITQQFGGGGEDEHFKDLCTVMHIVISAVYVYCSLLGPQEKDDSVCVRRI